MLELHKAEDKMETTSVLAFLESMRHFKANRFPVLLCVHNLEE